MRENAKNVAKKLSKYPLCDACFGRRFARLGYGMSNAERGRIIKGMLFLGAIAEADIETIEGLARSYEPARVFLAEKFGREISPEACRLCGGLLSPRKLDILADKVAREVLEAGVEFERFTVGSRGLEEYENKELALRSEVPTARGESIKHEFNRELAKRLSRILGKEPTTSEPDVVIIVTPEGLSELEIMPVFIRGRYRKLVRGLYQARQRWREAESIEELIGEVAKEFFEAEEYALHAAGREDVDVRMLGRGRPFVLELKNPRRRRVDLKELEKAINERHRGKIEVVLEGYASKSDVRELKSARHRKLYYAVVRVDGYTPEDLKRLEEKLVGVISQRTPLRVAHRRVDKVRKRRVYRVEAEPIDEKRFGLRVLADAGLYIKELVHGDSGRTKPSVAEILGKDAECESLDVIDIIDIPGEEHDNDRITLRY